MVLPEHIDRFEILHTQSGQRWAWSDKLVVEGQGILAIFVYILPTLCQKIRVQSEYDMMSW